MNKSQVCRWRLFWQFLSFSVSMHPFGSPPLMNLTLHSDRSYTLIEKLQPSIMIAVFWLLPLISVKFKLFDHKKSGSSMHGHLFECVVSLFVCVWNCLVSSDINFPFRCCAIPLYHSTLCAAHPAWEPPRNALSSNILTRMNVCRSLSQELETERLKQPSKKKVIEPNS